MNDFLGFRFGNIHSSDLHLVVISSSDRYQKDSLPELKDYSVEVSGGNGSNYFGSSYATRDFSLNVAFDDIDEKTWRKISQLFGDDRLRDLVFDELPYKVYKAKIKSKPEFKFICFTDRDTGQRVYKGDGTLVFTCYFPFAFGFNKYITRAADYYKVTPPKEIIENCLNVEGNMNTPWKGGYPTIEQVQNGELFFRAPEPVLEKQTDKVPRSIGPDDKVIDDTIKIQKEHCLIDVRGYWDNVPEWAESSKLLISPTLDFDGELIYMPQYSRRNYINMDTGINNENAIIGARVLVYNPGDLPMDFNLEMNFNDEKFKYFKDLRIKNRFQIRRRNVQRLTVPQTVEWTGLTTLYDEDNEAYKFGNRYVSYQRFLPEDETEIKEGDTVVHKKNTLSAFSKENMTLHNFQKCMLGDNHPNHFYISEPIPQEQLGRYIRMFYFQSEKAYEKDNRLPKLNYDDGAAMADRYEELRELCVDDDERNQLYWETLYELFKPYVKQLKLPTTITPDQELETYIEFFKDYIYQPQEFLVSDTSLNYGEEHFSIKDYPQYYTDDYLEIEFSDNEDSEIPLDIPYYFDSEKKMLYNIVKEGEFERSDKKLILNDFVVKGKWFQIPPGWSVIEIMPVFDEDFYINKTWQDASTFDWGYSQSKLPPFVQPYWGANPATAKDPSTYVLGADYMRYVFDLIYDRALEDYLGNVTKEESGALTFHKGLSNHDFSKEAIQSNTEFPNWRNRCINFRTWYSPDGKFDNTFLGQYNLNRTIKAELEFLKTIQLYWRESSKYMWEKKSWQTNGFTGDISEWWWYACNYAWQNFPPVYWAYADLISNVKINYTPLFY